MCEKMRADPRDALGTGLEDTCAASSDAGRQAVAKTAVCFGLSKPAPASRRTRLRQEGRSLSHLHSWLMARVVAARSMLIFILRGTYIRYPAVFVPSRKATIDAR